MAQQLRNIDHSRGHKSIREYLGYRSSLTMAGDPPNHQPPPSSSTIVNPAERQVHLEAKVEDAETRAARQELKHTVISDKTDAPTGASSHQPQRPHREDEEMRLPSGATGDLPPARAKTPDASATAASEKKVSSPKKKRAHDEVDQNKDGDGHRTSSGAESEGWVMVDGGDKDAEHRSEPQKKRARDETSPPADIHNKVGLNRCPWRMERVHVY